MALVPIDIDSIKLDMPNDNGAISRAILGQESGDNSDVETSTDNAVGPGQIIPETFAQYALPGEDINNPDDNRAVHKRIIDDLAKKANGDPARIAVGYFSGHGNIAPLDSPTPWKKDHSDGNGKSVSSYVGDVLDRLNPVSEAYADTGTPAGFVPVDINNIKMDTPEGYTPVDMDSIKLDPTTSDKIALGALATPTGGFINDAYNLAKSFDYSNAANYLGNQAIQGIVNNPNPLESAGEKVLGVPESIAKASIEGGKGLAGRLIAPFVSDEDRAVLQKQGFTSSYPIADQLKASGKPLTADDQKRILAEQIQQSPVGPYSSAAFGWLAPASDAFEGAEKTAGAGGVGQGNLDLLNAGLSIAGVGGMPHGKPEIEGIKPAEVPAIAEPAPTMRPDIPIESTTEAPEVAPVDINSIKMDSPDESASTDLDSYVPQYDFDTDSYIVSKPGGKEIGGFDRQEEAQAHADELNGVKSSPLEEPPAHVTEGAPVDQYEPSEVDKAASDVNPSPSPAQIEAGNYKKGHVNIHGLDISIENPRGSTRSGVDASGKPWEVQMPDHYGYIKGTEGADGEHVDAYVGSNPESEKVFIIDQNHAHTGKFDEHKAMLGYDTQEQAVDAYKNAFSDGRGEQRIGNVTATNVDGFKDWLKNENTKKPAVEAKIEQAPQGQQTVIPGAEKITEKALAERKMEQPLQAKKAQQAPDEGLFDTGAQRQTDLLDVKPKTEPAMTEHKVELVEPKLPARRSFEQLPEAGKHPIVKQINKVRKFISDLSDKDYLSLSKMYGDSTGGTKFPHAVSVTNEPLKLLKIWKDSLSKQEQKPLTNQTVKPSEIGKPTSLYTFIRNNGKIRPDIHDAGDLLSQGHKDLISQNGKPVDTMRELAEQHGYIKEGMSVPDFHDLINDTNGGREHFRDVDADKILNKREKSAEQQANDPAYVEHVAHTMNIETKGKTLTQIKKLINDALGEDSLMQRVLSDEGGAAPVSVHKDIRDIIAPTMAGEGAKKTAGAIRRAYGEASRRKAIDETELTKFAKQSSKLDDTGQRDFYKYVEGRSQGAKLKDPSLQGMADGIRKVYDRTKAKLQSMPENRQMRFVQDYFTHMWDDEAAAAKFTSDFIAQQGSLRSLKKRMIPTIEEGLAAGLKLKEPNPVRAVSRYVGSMNNYIASVDALRSITQDLGGGYYAKGIQPDGYEPLVGHNAERIENAKVDPASGKLIPARTLQLYAPSDVATIYNRFYSKGFEDTKAKSVYELARGAINANTMMELGLSTYHAGTITIQSLNQDFARILKNAKAGDWKGVVDAAKKFAKPAFMGGSHYKIGLKGIEQYKALKDHGVDMEAMADHFAKANLHLGQDPLSRMAHRGFYKAAQRGELPELLDKLKKQAKEGYGLGLLKSGAEVMGRVVSDVSAPLFDHYIPAIKMSSFMDLMGDWLRQNPLASKEQIQVQQSRIGNLIDDRFGELNMENIFWNKMSKQVTGLAFRAPGWDLGLIRQVGGPPLDMYRMLHDAATGKKFNPDNLDRPLYLASAAALYAATNSTMTYLKTCKTPSEQDLKDLINYRTGGTYHTLGRNVPERGVLPGHAKEVENLRPIPSKGPLSGIAEEASNKVASLPKNLFDAWMNTDWKNKPIYDPKSKSWVESTPGVAQAAYVAKGFEPFSITNIAESKPGSHLSVMERALGVKPAGAKIVARKELGEYLQKKQN
jgi:hypothetical protein